MSDNVELNIGSGGKIIATDDISGVQHQYVKVEFGVDGSATPVSTADPLPIAGNVNVANLPATQPVSGAVSVDNFPATQAVSGTVNVGNLPATQPVSGTVAVSNFPATQPISGSVSVSNFPATQPVSIAATVEVKEVRATTPTTTSPAVTNSNTSILASNSNRLGATIYNEGAAICYMILGSTATTTSYTLQIQVGGYYEVPFGYTGAIFGITSAGTATLRVTEIS